MFDNYKYKSNGMEWIGEYNEVNCRGYCYTIS